MTNTRNAAQEDKGARGRFLVPLLVLFGFRNKVSVGLDCAWLSGKIRGEVLPPSSHGVTVSALDLAAGGGAVYAIHGHSEVWLFWRLSHKWTDRARLTVPQGLMSAS